MLYRPACVRRNTPGATRANPVASGRRHVGHGLALALALLLAACQTVSRQPPVATLPVLDEAEGLFVAARIDGQPIKLLLDTGSARSVLTSEAAARLGLTIEHMVDDTEVMMGSAIEGIGGRRHIDRAVTHRLDLGGMTLRGTAFAVVESRHTGWDPAGDGILGLDMLSQFDLDLDVDRGVLALYGPGGMGAPSGGLAVSVPPHASRLLQDMTVWGPITMVTLGGRPMTALIDTGAQRSFLLAHAAGRVKAGLQGTPLSVTGIGTGRESAILRSFDSMSVGGVALPRTTMAVLRTPLLAHLDIVLGVDVLRHLHTWFSASQQTVFVASR